MLGMDLEAAELLAGEQILLSKAANAVIKLSDYGLQRLPYDQLTNLIGFKGKEAVGGKLHLTNFRLVFKAHPINRVQGKFSIFLPAIIGFRNTSPNFLMKRLEVRTELQLFEFVVWGVDDFIRTATQDQQSLTPGQKEALRKAVMAKPEQFISDTRVSQTVNNLSMKLPEIVKKAAEIATNPLDISAAINVLEIMRMVFEKDGK